MKIKFQMTTISFLLALVCCKEEKITKAQPDDHSSKIANRSSTSLKPQAESPSAVNYNPHEVMAKANDQIKPSLGVNENGSKPITQKEAKEVTQALINNASVNVTNLTKKAMEDAAQSARDAAEMMDQDSK